LAIAQRPKTHSSVLPSQTERSLGPKPGKPARAPRAVVNAYALFSQQQQSNKLSINPQLNGTIVARVDHKTLKFAAFRPKRAWLSSFGSRVAIYCTEGVQKWPMYRWPLVCNR